MPNYRRPQDTAPIGYLPTGEALYPAYYPLRVNERRRCGMSWWNGGSGETVGVTVDGQLWKIGLPAGHWTSFKLGNEGYG